MKKEEIKKLMHEEGVKNGKKAWEAKRAKYGDDIGDVQRRGPAAKVSKKRGKP
jgi:hypothetical protein